MEIEIFHSNPINTSIEWAIKFIAMLFWSVILYLYFVYGIGMEGGPWEDV